MNNSDWKTPMLTSVIVMGLGTSAAAATKSVPLFQITVGITILLFGFALGRMR